MKLFVVGLGPGGLDQITPAAIDAIEQSDVIAGYTVYVDLIRQRFADKTFLTTPMKQEVDRCRMAIEETVKGKNVSMVCSGDAGVYGAMSGAAVLGAPLIHDFAVISLSDLLTPLDKIMTRVELAAQGDFVLCFYNPASKKRTDYLRQACERILRHRSADTPCGYVRNIGREGEQATVLTLAELAQAQVDMFTTVFVGNSQTKLINGKLVTPRGYKNV